MNKIKKILCPIDFSEYSNEAMTYALQLAEANKSNIHLLHVIPQMNYYDWNVTGMYALISEDTFKKEKEETIKKMDALITDVKTKLPTVEITFSIDEPNTITNEISDHILAVAKEKEVNLIVMGSHGRRGLNRLLMGSIAESVMRHAHCGVMIFKMQID